MWKEADLPATRVRCSASSRATAQGNDIVVLDPEDRRERADPLRLPAASPRRPASAWPTSFPAPAVDGKPPVELDVIGVGRRSRSVRR